MLDGYVTRRSIFGSDGNGIVVKRLNSDEDSSADSDDESTASSSGRSNSDAPVAKVPRTSDEHKPSNLLISVRCSLKFAVASNTGVDCKQLICKIDLLIVLLVLSKCLYVG